MFKKKLSGMIFIAMLFVGMFFVTGKAEALDCCLIMSASDGTTPSGCILLENNKSCLSGSKQANCLSNDLCDSLVDSVKCCLTSYSGKELDCHLIEESTPCSIGNKSFSIDNCPVKLEYTKGTGRHESKGYCPVTGNIEKVNCTSRIFCKEQVFKGLKDCTTIINKPECDLVSSLCFWSMNRNMCFSRSDVSYCSGFNKADCLETKGVCAWTPPEANDTDGQCLSPLLKGVSDQYKYDETKYKFLPSCAITGNCKSLDMILFPVLKIVQWIFKYIGALAFIFFVYGGFTMILSFGNSEKFKKGQQVLVAAVIGLVIVFGAYLMISFVLEALGVEADFTAIK